MVPKMVYNLDLKIEFGITLINNYNILIQLIFKKNFVVYSFLYDF